MRQTCSVPGCGTMLKTHDAQRLGLCWTHRGPRSNHPAGQGKVRAVGERGSSRMESQVAPGHDRDGGRTGVGIPAALTSPCFYHRTPDKWSCEECVRIGEQVHERIGSGFEQWV